ncbi:MAG: SGNH/GDSL hydrolase family protein [Microbacteriaceae bacterium]
MHTRSIFTIGLAVLVVGVLVGLGAAVLSMNGPNAHPGSASSSAASAAPSNPTSTPRADATPSKPGAANGVKPTASAGPTPVYSDYIALGDSYAAGMGGGSETGRCRRSPNSYPRLIGASSSVQLERTVACSGATTADVQRDQLAALGSRVGLVTLTVGGNDLDVATLADACARGLTRSCQTEFRTSLTLLNVLPDRLAATYGSVVKAAPTARVVVTGYPILFAIPQTDSPEFSTIAVVNAATASMNQLIETAVAKKKKSGANISYVPISFAGHEIGTKDPWITTSGPDIYHPNAAGYQAMAKAVARALQ